MNEWMDEWMDGDICVQEMDVIMTMLQHKHTGIFSHTHEDRCVSKKLIKIK